MYPDHGYITGLINGSTLCIKETEIRLPYAIAAKVNTIEAEKVTGTGLTLTTVLVADLRQITVQTEEQVAEAASANRIIRTDLAKADRTIDQTGLAVALASKAAVGDRKI